jgi:hypothetical protein
MLWSTARNPKPPLMENILPDADNIVTLAAVRDDDAAYERERAELVGNTPAEAGVRWNQALALLVFKFSQRPGWTEQRLADKEKALGNKGASQSYIHRKIVFGEFLTIMPNRHNGEIPSWMPNLAETRFRQHWEMAKSAPDKETRFREVARLLTQSEEWQRQSKNPVREAIRERYTDGKWHELGVIARAVDEDEGVVKATLDRMTHVQAKDYKCEREIAARGRIKYRIVPTEKMISTFELVEKLGPIIEYLRVEGRKHMATSTISAARTTASQLQKLLDEWTK